MPGAEVWASAALTSSAKMDELSRPVGLRRSMSFRRCSSGPASSLANSISSASCFFLRPNSHGRDGVLWNDRVERLGEDAIERHWRAGSRLFGEVDGARASVDAAGVLARLFRLFPPPIEILPLSQLRF